jgi:predicted negative regulator of RcsB-dependent stress response
VPIDAAVAAAAPPDAGADELAKGLIDQAGSAYRKKRYNDALALVDQSLEQRRTARGFQLKGQILLAARKLDDALAAIDQAIALAGSSAASWYWKGQILFTRGDKSEARAAFERSLELKDSGQLADEIRVILDSGVLD